VARAASDAVRNFRYAMRLGADPGDGAAVRRAGRSYRVAVHKLQNVRADVLALLRRTAAEPALYYAYLAYAQQLDRVRRKYSCLVLANEAGHFTDYWLSWGLEPGVVEQVCRAVLGFFPRPLARPCSACDRRRGCRLRCEPVTIL